MLVKDSKGRAVELYLYGDEPDDIQVEDIFYADDESDVPEDEVEYIMDKYADAIYEEFAEQQAARYENYSDSLEDR